MLLNIFTKTLSTSLLLLLVTVAQGKVQIIAHRGAAGFAPENTLAAVKKAIELNSPLIEIDVHMTKDGEVVVIHDDSIDRTTNGKGQVKDFTLKEIQQFDAGTWYNKKFKDEKVPTLQQVLNLIKPPTKLVIEVKDGNDVYPEIEKKIVSSVNQSNLQESVIYKSFKPKILNEFKKLAPNVERLYCFIGSYRFFMIDTFLRIRSALEIDDVTYYQAHYYFLTKSLVDRVHEKNKKIIAWGVNKPEHFRKMKDWGVDFIETDFPDISLRN